MNIHIELIKTESNAILKFNTENENNALEVLGVLDQTMKQIKLALDEVFVTEGSEVAVNCTMDRFQSIIISKDN